MFCVFSIGSKKMSHDIFSAIGPDFKAILFDGKEVLCKGFGKNLLLISSKNAISSQMPVINVFARDFAGNVAALAENSISIVSSENKGLLLNLSKTKSRVVTCGMCAKDTITCTSINENNAVIAMQRTLTDISGKCHMPFETPVKITHSSDIYDKMATLALLTILGVNN